MKHTKGPWEAEKGNRNFIIIKEVNSCQTITAIDVRSHYDYIDRGVAKANAHLMATAPDMLESLEKAGDIITQHNLLSTATDEEKNATINRLIDWNNNFRIAAINKAKGR